MMTGLLIWKEKEPGARQKAVEMEEKRVLHTCLLCAGVLREERTPEPVLRRRVLAAAKKLRRAGANAVVLQEDLPREWLPERTGLQPVSTVPLRRLIAADWLRLELERRGLAAPSTKVAVSAPRLTGEVVRTVTELVLRHRYVLLDVPYGMEEFSRRLRRSYGVSLLDGTDREQLARAEAVLCFGGGDAVYTNAVVLRPEDETLPLPPLLLPPVVEECFPAGADRSQMAALLLRSGALRPGQVSVAGTGT